MLGFEFYKNLEHVAITKYNTLRIIKELTTHLCIK